MRLYYESAKVNRYIIQGLDTARLSSPKAAEIKFFMWLVIAADCSEMKVLESLTK